MNVIDALLGLVGQFLGWLDHVTGSYMLALFIFAIIVEVILLPIGIKQQKNSIRQAYLRPKEMAIRKKYAGRNDQVTQQKVTAEIQDMYQKENFNPLGGCLPLLLQFPIIIALYNVVVNPLQYVMGVGKNAVNSLRAFVYAAVDKGGLGIEGKASSSSIELINILETKWNEIQAGFVSFVKGGGVPKLPEGADAEKMLEELSDVLNKDMPNFNFLGIDLAGKPEIQQISWLWIIPVLTFVVYFFSMKITRKFTYQPTNGDDKQTGCSNTVMDIAMPGMSVYFTFIMPGAIGVYWIFKSIIGTLKQFILSRTMPLPVFTEEDYKAAEREYAGKPADKEKARKLDINSGRSNPNSLFHIDDEDYVPPVDDERFNTERPAEKTGVVETAPIKKDDRRSAKDNDSSEKDNNEQ